MRNGKAFIFFLPLQMPTWSLNAMPCLFQSRGAPQLVSHSSKNFVIELTETQYNQTGLRVKRQLSSTSSDQDPILSDTTYFAEGFIYANQFLQIITTLPSNNIYGEWEKPVNYSVHLYFF